MAVRLNNGLFGFTRKQIGLHPSKDRYTGHQIKGASIHHGGPVGRPRVRFAHAAQTWRDWQSFHQNQRGWDDIGYNLGVDALGRLYQGRPCSAVPAAVGGHNTGYPGINFMQDGRSWGLTPLQRRTLKVLFEHGVPAWGLPPLKTLDVRGHQEFRGHESNECPGPKIMRHLRWRRRQY